MNYFIFIGNNQTNSVYKQLLQRCGVMYRYMCKLSNVAAVSTWMGDQVVSHYSVKMMMERKKHELHIVAKKPMNGISPSFFFNLYTCH